MENETLLKGAHNLEDMSLDDNQEEDEFVEELPNNFGAFASGQRLSTKSSLSSCSSLSYKTADGMSQFKDCLELKEDIEAPTLRNIGCGS